MLESPEERANLHAMATLYLCRGIALLDARDDLAASALTETELFCLDQRQAGWCDLDIAEALDRSVQAVKVHVQRARQKQAA
jgi:DNA-binding NarL/FixJ family response regulator